MEEEEYDDREAKFLAAQSNRILKNKQLRLVRRNYHNKDDETFQKYDGDEQDDDEKLTETKDPINSVSSFLYSSDIHDQFLRRQFWILFKDECSQIRILLDSFLSSSSSSSSAAAARTTDVIPISNDDNAQSAEQFPTTFMYVTAQQRNEALLKIREVKSRIRHIQQWTQHSSSSSSSGETSSTSINKDIKSSPTNYSHHNHLFAFIQKHNMVELVSADTRLMQIELHSLRDYADEIEIKIQPKEKFSFRKYRAYLYEKSSMVNDNNKNILTDECVSLLPPHVQQKDHGTKEYEEISAALETPSYTGTTTTTVSSVIESTPSNHLILSDRKYCRITVQANGEIKDGIDLDTLNTGKRLGQKVLLMEKDDLLKKTYSSYIIRNIVNCHACL